VAELDESGVLDAVRLARRGREDDPFRDRLVMAEADFVVRAGQNQHSGRDQVELALVGSDLAPHVTNRLLELAKSELISKYAHNLIGELAVDAQLRQLAMEERLLVERIRQELGFGDDPRRGIDCDPVRAVDHAGPKGNRGDMPLAGCSQTNDESVHSLREARLVGVPDHGRIEQGRRFQGVLLSEVRPDQKLAALAQLLVGEQEMLDEPEAFAKELPGRLMPVEELAEHVLEEPLNFWLREGHHARNDLDGTVLVDRPERPDDDPRIRRC